MKAQIFYMAIALVLVFSLAAVAIVPASPVMADESDVSFDVEIIQG